MVARHGKLRTLLFDYKINQVRLRGEFVTKTKSIIKQSEAYNHPAIGAFLSKYDGQFIVIFADGFTSPQTGVHWESCDEVSLLVMVKSFRSDLLSFFSSIPNELGLITVFPLYNNW